MTQEERDHIMDLVEKVHTEQTTSRSSHLAFLLECVKQAFSREVWEEVADERNRDHHVPLSSLFPGRAPQKEQES